jgi:tetratricopeptide (TPR) repeat protein
MNTPAILVAGFVFLCSFFVFLPDLRNGFVNWDDDYNVSENPYIRSFNSAFFRWAFLDLSAPGADYWRPLSYLSHALDYAIWGLNPMGHHLTNNILHAVNTFLVVLLVVRLLTVWQAGRLTSSHGAYFALITAATTGLLFGLHPIHVESVAWVSERKDLLCALFFLLSILMYTGYVSKPKPVPGFFNKQYLLSLGFFILALLSKPMAVSLPLVLLILDWYPFARITTLKTFKTAFTEKTPFIALSIGLSVLTAQAQKEVGAMELMNVVPLSTRLIVSADAVFSYIGKMLLPLRLIPIYDYPQDVSLTSITYLVPVLSVIGITIACIYMYHSKKQRLWIVLWGYYVVTLLPVLGIVQVGYQSMADRYTYLPSLGPFLVAGLFVAWFYNKAVRQKKAGVVVRVAGMVLVVAVFIATSYASIRQISVWNNSLDLWNYTLNVTSGRSPVAYYHRGNAFGEQGRYDQSIEDYSMAIALKPDYFEVYHNRGAAYHKKGQYDLAIADYTRALALKPNSKTYNNRGDTFISKGLLDQAMEDFNTSIALNPDFDEAYSNRGVVYYLGSDYDHALRDFSRAIALNHNNATAYINRAYVHIKMHREGHAVPDLKKACELGNPNGCRDLENLLHQPYILSPQSP